MTPDTHLISIDPATLEEIGRTPVSTPEEIDTRIAGARDAFTTWRSDRAHRQSLLAKCSERLMARLPELAEILSLSLIHI